LAFADIYFTAYFIIAFQHFTVIMVRRERQRAADQVTSSTAFTSNNAPAADQQFLKLMNVVS